MRQRLRNKGARKRKGIGCTRHAVKQLVKDKLLYNWKSTHERGAETPEERETRNGSSAIRHFERGDEDVTK